MAFVVVQHLSADYRSLMVELLDRNIAELAVLGRRLEELLHVLEIGVVLLDPGGVLQHANETALRLFPALGRALGSPLAEVPSGAFPTARLEPEIALAHRLGRRRTVALAAGESQSGPPLLVHVTPAPIGGLPDQPQGTVVQLIPRE